LIEILKSELGFQGYIMSDWNAQHTATGSANMFVFSSTLYKLLRHSATPTDIRNSGMDMTMLGSDFNKGNILWVTSLTSGGQVSQSRVDDMVKRILAAW
jgi:beta-glucosidase